MTSGPYGFRYLKVATEELRRELYLTSIGSLLYRPGQSYPGPGHPKDYDFSWSNGRVLGDFAAVLIEKGSGKFESRSGRFECASGDVLVISPGAWHRYRPNLNTGWHERWVCANGEYLHRLRTKHRLFEEAEVLHPDNAPAVGRAMQALYRSVTLSAASNDLATAAQTLTIFGLILRGAQELGREKSAPPATGDDVAAAAREFIWFNSHRPLTVEIITQHLRVSRRTLERRFAAAYGRHVVAELIDRRVQRARQLLAETTMSVKEISYAVGFGESRRLIRNFIAVFGTTPGAFRKSRTS